MKNALDDDGLGIHDEADAVIANAETEFSGIAVEFFDVAFAGLGQTDEAQQRCALRLGYRAAGYRPWPER